MKQQCPMALIYTSWAVLAGGLVYFVAKADYVSVLVLLAAAPLALWGYVRFFPAISRYIGYGRVDDRPATETARVSTKVTLYTALGCPFCPIVKRRLLALQPQMGFDLEEVDVTLRPDLLMAKGIQAVPVVEVGGRRTVGHMTSEQLTTFLLGWASLT
ncbi:MAG: glutaredoxin family protein [Chloroflexi bacterium]|nr:glutaredoxin family protein [Chloroflexota bacterium]